MTRPLAATDGVGLSLPGRSLSPTKKRGRLARPRSLRDTAPGPALGSVPTVALSSARATTILPPMRPGRQAPGPHVAGGARR